jgi:hypothetical protein
MVHPDHETRVVAHRIFSVILVPTASEPKASGVPRTLSRAVSFFTSSASLFEKLKLEKRSASVRLSQYNKENVVGEVEPANSNVGIINRLKSSHSRVSSVNNPPLTNKTDGITANGDNQNSVSLAFEYTLHI